jgi:serine/threonine-protein kinase
MNKIYCSQGHENPTGSRFCLHCGEKISATPINYGIQPGQTLGDRYVIVRQIGQGGFGRTYLAEDINRFREACVLKEFFPQIQTPEIIQKAEELFQREASILYKLQHPQIPRFREFLRTNVQGKESLFLVQDYVEGQTYSDLLRTRQQQGLRFTELEVRQLLLQILPVLGYIHSLGVIHRDISPDNLMLRTADQLPVLIDFGGVKQVAATVASQYYQGAAGQGNIPSPSSGTLLGKIGYAPPEQMQTGMVYPYSDLYALAVTVVVLLTGKQPEELVDTYNLTWQWRREVSVSPALGQILERMLSSRPGDRFQSAQQVLSHLDPQSLANHPPTQQPTQPPISGTVAIAPPQTPNSYQTPTNSTPPWLLPMGAFLFTLLLAGGLGLGLKLFHGAGNEQSAIEPTEISTSSPSSSPTTSSVASPTPVAPQYSPEELKRQEALNDKRQQLGIDPDFFNSLVYQAFWEQNPALKGHKLSKGPEEESARADWDKTANQILDKLAILSRESRNGLGSFTLGKFGRLETKLSKIHVGSSSVYALGDAAFYHQFPELHDTKSLPKPWKQVWYGFINDQINAILSGNAFQEIKFAANETSQKVNGELQPGEGKVFVASLAKDQSLKVNLDADTKILLSIYPPSGKIKLLVDSPERAFSTKLTQGGYYEFVVVSTASEKVNYQFTIVAENPPLLPAPISTESPTPNVTTTPIPTPQETNLNSNP